MTKDKKPKSRGNVFTPFMGCAQIYYQRWYVRSPRGKFHLHGLLRRALSVLRQPKGEKVSEYDGQTYRPKYHEDLVHSEITLPPNASKEYEDRAALWNAACLSEKGQKSQLARMLKASLPNDWSYELAEEVVRDYVQRTKGAFGIIVDKGMCADWAIHDSENDKGQRNLHIHVLLTMRPFTENGEWGAKSKKIFDLDENGERIPVIDKKTGQQKVDKRNRKQWKCHTEDSTGWNSKENAKMWRQDLADTINATNEQSGTDFHTQVEKIGTAKGTCESLCQL